MVTVWCFGRIASVKLCENQSSGGKVTTSSSGFDVCGPRRMPGACHCFRKSGAGLDSGSRSTLCVKSLVLLQKRHHTCRARHHVTGMLLCVSLTDGSVCAVVHRLSHGHLMLPSESRDHLTYFFRFLFTTGCVKIQKSTHVSFVYACICRVKKIRDLKKW